VFQEDAMVLKYMVAMACLGALAVTAPACAADYQPDDYLNLDLSKAVLSPRPLGPSARFESVPVEAKADRARTAARPDMGGDPRKVATTRIRVARPRMAGRDIPVRSLAVRNPAVRNVAVRHVPVRVARSQESKERPRGAGRVRLAHRHGNPLDAQAMDTRIQTWPCRPGNGGICQWR
jgi:hypothetical protein